jgi:hypothetical protein
MKTSSNVIVSWDYTLGDAGERLSVTETAPIGAPNAADYPRVVNYTYDNLYRLTGETVTTGSGAGAITNVTTYTYDAVSNRLSKKEAFICLSSL